MIYGEGSISLILVAPTLICQGEWLDGVHTAWLLVLTDLTHLHSDWKKRPDNFVNILTPKAFSLKPWKEKC